MSRRFGRSGRLTLVAVATASITLGGIALLAPGTSDAASTSRAAVASHGPIQKLDHFLCYHVVTKGYHPPANILLSNWLQPAPFAPAFGVPTAHCNPTVKQVSTVTGALRTYKVAHPAAHLLCWAIGDKFAPLPVHLVNQFGTSVMETTGGATSLCLPSWKKRTGPPNKKPTAPTGLDHFACYGLVRSSASYGFKVPSLVKVKDEFSYPRFAQVKVGIANVLCIPTTKIAAGVKYPPANAKDLSLTCFPVSKTPYWKSFFDENQFGQGEVFPTQPVTTAAVVPFEELCLPTAAIIG